MVTPELLLAVRSISVTVPTYSPTPMEPMVTTASWPTSRARISDSSTENFTDICSSFESVRIFFFPLSEEEDSEEEAAEEEEAALGSRAE